MLTSKNCLCEYAYITAVHNTAWISSNNLPPILQVIMTEQMLASGEESRNAVPAVGIRVIDICSLIKYSSGRPRRAVTTGNCRR